MAAYSGYTGATDTTAVANATIDRFIPAKMLEVAEYNAQLYNLCPHIQIPPGESQTVTFIKYNHLALPTSPLAEGDSGSATAGTTSRVSCVTEAWGAWQIVSSLGQYIAKGSPADIYATRQGVQAARVIDREIVRQLMGATTKYYPGTATTRAGIGTTDTLTYTLLRKVRARMKRTGAPFYQGNKHVLVCGPEVAADLVTVDPTMINAIIYQKYDVLVSGEIGEIAGFRIVESNTLPQLTYVTTGPTPTTPAASGSETAVSGSDTHVTVMVTANDADGFETFFYSAVEVTNFTAGDVIAVVTPSSLPTGGTSFNVYMTPPQAAQDLTTLRLQVERVAASVTLHITGNGLAASGTGVAFSTSGRVVGIAPATTAGLVIHPVFFFGNEFFKCTQIKNITTYRTSGASKSDPLNRYQTLGWVIEGFKALITDQTFGGMIECASSN